MGKPKPVLNAGLKALLASAKTSTLGKGAATFTSELAALPDDQQEVLARLTQDQFNELLIQSELSTINAAEAAAGTRQIKELLINLAKRGKTILLCSHLLADVEDVCDRIAILYGGKVQAMGQVKALLG